MNRNVNGSEVEMSDEEVKEFLDQQAKDAIEFAPKEKVEKLSNGALADLLVEKGILQSSDLAVTVN